MIQLLGHLNILWSKRAVDKVRRYCWLCLKKVAVISTLLEGPTTRETLSAKGFTMSPEQQKRAETDEVIVSDAGSLLTTLKGTCLKDSHATMQCTVSKLCRTTVTRKKLQKDVSETLDIDRNRIATGIKYHKRVLNDNSGGWTQVKWKRRKDATAEEHFQLACDFWTGPGVSRPTGSET